MGFIQGIKSKLGFGDEWEDDEYDEQPEEEGREGNDFDAHSRKYPYESPYGSGASLGAVRRRARVPDLERASAASGERVRPVPSTSSELTPASEAQMRIHNARPQSFDEAREIGDRFRNGTPVVLDLSQVPLDQQRRFIDFASGLTYGLDGEINKVADGVFMLTPHNVEMSENDRRHYSSSSYRFGRDDRL